MNKELFIKNFAAQFEDTDSSVFNENTKFRDLKEWGSLVHLSIILMLDREYGVTIDESDFNTLYTVGDIFNYLANK